MRAMLYKLGRILQVIGMILLPVAIAGNLAPDQPLDLRAFYAVTGVGVLLFTIGWLLQQAGKGQ